MTAARAGLSVHREDEERAAEEFAKGINAVLAYLVSTGDLNDHRTALRVREHFSDRGQAEAAE